MPKGTERIIVTGGCGFIGSNLVDRLLKDGHEVLVVDNLCSGKRENVSGALNLSKLDVWSEEKKMKKVFQKFKPDVVFHLAAQKDVHQSMLHPMRDAQVNIIGSLNVLEAMRSIGGGRVVFASTAAVYDADARLPISESSRINPISPYGISKRAAEMYMWNFANHYPVAAISLRFSNAYGPRGKFGTPNAADIFIDKMLKGDTPKIFGSGEQTRDFIYIDDMIEAFVRAMKVAWCGEVNIATNTETSINRLYDLIAGEVGFEGRPEYDEAREGEIFQSRLDPSLAQEVLGWKPAVSIEEGIKRTVDWYKHV